MISDINRREGTNLKPYRIQSDRRVVSHLYYITLILISIDVRVQCDRYATYYTYRKRSFIILPHRSSGRIHNHRSSSTSHCCRIINDVWRRRTCARPVTTLEMSSEEKYYYIIILN